MVAHAHKSARDNGESARDRSEREEKRAIAANQRGRARVCSDFATLSLSLSLSLSLRSSSPRQDLISHRLGIGARLRIGKSNGNF